jgi:putative ABC transport system substrate-binding protein
MRRREFITLLGGAAAWPLAARAQQDSRMRQIGVLLPPSASDPETQLRTEALMGGLQALGWIDGKNATFVIRSAEGHPERLSVLAAEFASAKVDVLVTTAVALNQSVRNATGNIPIVMASSGDAVGTGLIASLAHPGGNITGLTVVGTETVVKRLQLARNFSKDWIRVAALFDANSLAHRLQITALEQAAPALGFRTHSFPSTAADIDNNLQTAVSANAQVIFTLDGPLTETHREGIVGFATRRHLAVIAENKPLVKAGALMSYSPNPIDLWRRAGDYVDKILKGAKAADLPVEQPTRFEFIINLKAARTLGLEIPPTLLALADEVIE